MEGDIKQSLSPVAAPSWGYGGRHQSIDVIRDCFSGGNGRRHKSNNVNSDCLFEGMEGDIKQSMSYVLTSWGYGRRHQTICVICDCPSWVNGRRHQSIYVIYADFLKVWKETPNNLCYLWLPLLRVWKETSINVTCNCLLEGMEGDINQCHL